MGKRKRAPSIEKGEMGVKMGIVLRPPPGVEKVERPLRERGINRVVLLAQPQLGRELANRGFQVCHIEWSGVPTEGLYSAPVRRLSEVEFNLLYYQRLKLELPSYWRREIRGRMRIVGYHRNRRYTPRRLRISWEEEVGGLLFKIGYFAHRDRFQAEERQMLFLFRFIYYGFHLPYIFGNFPEYWDRYLVVSLIKELLMNYPPTREGGDFDPKGPGGFSWEYLTGVLRLGFSIYRWGPKTLLYLYTDLLDTDRFMKNGLIFG